MINRLTELYKERGQNFIDKLFAQPILITEQTNASTFSVQRFDSDLKFYKRESDRPINEIDRTLVKFYEAPINKMERLSPDIKSSMPEGWRFGMEYLIESGDIKLNLTHIQVRNKSGNIVRTIHDKQTLDFWAKNLKVLPPRIVFEGVLPEDTRSKVLNWLYGDRNGSIVTLLGESLSGKKLRSKELIIRFIGEDDHQLAKVIDDIFENVPQAPQKEKTDIYNLTILDFMNFLSDRGLTRYKPIGKTTDQRYVSFISRAFNDFISLGKGESYKTVDFNEPEFMQTPEFDVNIDKIQDSTTKNILENPQMRRLFKIILAALRKKKKKPAGIMTKDVLAHFNTLIDEINEYIAIPELKLTESALPSFSQFREITSPIDDEDEVDDDDDDDKKDSPDFDNHFEPEVESEEVESEEVESEDNDEVEDVSSEEDDTIADDPQEPDQMDITGLLTTIDSTEEDNEIEGPNKTKAQKVNVIVGRFQPLHNGHLQMAESLKKYNDLPCVFVVVHTGSNKSGRSPITKESIVAMMEGAISRTENIIGYTIIERGLMEDVVKALRPTFEPILWGAGSDRFNGYLKQAEYNTKSGNPLRLSDEFDIFKTERVTSGTSIRQMIEDDDYQSFKKLVPPAVVNMWTIFRKDIINDKNNR